MVVGTSILRKGFIQVRGPVTIEVAEVVKGAGLKIGPRWVRGFKSLPRYHILHFGTPVV